MSVYEKLSKVQSELIAPKGQYNSFGKYKIGKRWEIFRVFGDDFYSNRRSRKNGREFYKQ